LNEIRCVKCRRLLMKGAVIEVEVKCPKCGYLNFLIDNVPEKTFKKLKDMLNRKSQFFSEIN
jgi:phage FluMu protein Com